MFKKLKELRAELLAEITCELFQFVNNPSKKQIVGAGAYAGVCGLIGTSQVAGAASSSGFFNKLNDLLQQVYGWLIGTVSAVAIVLLTVCGFKYMFASEPKEASEAKAWIKRIIFVWVFVCLIPLFSGVIADLTNKSELRKSW